MSRFQNKSVIVTGSSGGIGRATAIAYAKEGANLVLADVNEEGVNGIKDVVTELVASAIGVVADVSCRSDVSSQRAA